MLSDGVYALTAEGDPNVGAIEGEDFLVCFEAMATPVAAQKWRAAVGAHVLHTGAQVRGQGEPVLAQVARWGRPAR